MCSIASDNGLNAAMARERAQGSNSSGPLASSQPQRASFQVPRTAVVGPSLSFVRRRH